MLSVSEMISGGNRRDCIRLRNLPLDCGVEQILEFLGVHSQHIMPQGVHMIYNSQVIFEKTFFNCQRFKFNY